MSKSNFKVWEIFLIFISFVLLLLSLYIYIIEFPIRNYIFDLPEESSHVIIGTLNAKTGSIRRQVLGEIEFKGIQDKSNLFNMDTIVTGDDSSANLNFDDGSTVQLGSNTMIRLSFLKNITFTGLRQYGKIEVITGQVTGVAGKNKLLLKNKSGTLEVKPNTTQIFKTKQLAFIPVAAPSVLPSVLPSPIESPSVEITQEEAKKTKILSAKVDDLVELDKEHAVVRKKVYLKWKTALPTGSILVHVTKIIQKTKDSTIKRDQVFSKVVQSKRSIGQLGFLVNEPGHYEWKITNTDGQPITSHENSIGHFVVTSEFVGIKILPPLIAGNESKSNKLTQELLKDQDFEIKLRWEKYQNATQYFMWFGKSPTSQKPLLEKEVHSEEYKFNKNKFFAGKFFYKITTPANHGYVASSGIQEFNFSFDPPVQTLPENQAIISLKDLKRAKKLMLTWQKTNFTQGYELEVSLTPDFSRIYLRKKFVANFYFIPISATGQYWWRVRGFSNSLSSPMSPPAAFTIIP